MMDTRDQALTKLTRLHDESHPTPHRPASLRRNYSLPVGSIMELATKKGYDEDQRSSSPEPQTDSKSCLPMKNMRRRWLCLVKRDNSFSFIFSGNMCFYSVGFRVCRATRWGQPTWARLEGVACPGGLCPPRCPLRWFLAPEILFY